MTEFPNGVNPAMKAMIARIRRARSTGDSVDLAVAADISGERELGSDELSYEHGLAELMMRGESAETDDERNFPTDPEFWKQVAEIALPYFAPLDTFEHIRVSEIRSRLQKLNQVGYPVEGYSHLQSGQLWEYFQGVRREIRHAALSYCPSTLTSIEARNKQQERDAKEIR